MAAQPCSSLGREARQAQNLQSMDAQVSRGALGDREARGPINSGSSTRTWYGAAWRWQANSAPRAAIGRAFARQALTQHDHLPDLPCAGRATACMVSHRNRVRSRGQSVAKKNGPARRAQRRTPRRLRRVWVQESAQVALELSLELLLPLVVLKMRSVDLLLQVRAHTFRVAHVRVEWTTSWPAVFVFAFSAVFLGRVEHRISHALPWGFCRPAGVASRR